MLGPAQCGVQVRGTGFEVRLPRLDMSLLCDTGPHGQCGQNIGDGAVEG